MQRGRRSADHDFDEVSGERFEYRLVDGVFWQGVPQPDDERRWFGNDLEELNEAVGNQVSGAVDGGLLVESMMEALVRVLGVERRGDGSTAWLADFDGDGVGPSSGGAGTYGRLLEAGFDGETGIDVKGVVVVNPDGRLTSIMLALGPWWKLATEEASGTHFNTLAVTAVLTISKTDPFVVEAPCTDPETEVANGLTTLSCP